MVFLGMTHASLKSAVKSLKRKKSYVRNVQSGKKSPFGSHLGFGSINLLKYHTCFSQIGKI
jgi:hypothetical protein